jgi:hypothetical protein
MTTTISLSNIDTDFEAYKEKLRTYLIANAPDTWNNALAVGTGDILLSLAAYVGVTDLLSIEAALQETSPDTARSSKSILNIARTIWGIHLQRKIPASIPCTLTNTSGESLTIAKYSQFTINGVNCFNRAAINLSPNSSASVTLYQGTVTSESRTTTGIINERFYLGTSGDAFGISDLDLYCIVNNTEEYTKTTEGLFKAGDNGSKVFYENSLPTGEVEVLFGDGFYGKLPTTNSQLEFIYVNTIGKATNGTLPIGSTVSYLANPVVTGITTGAASSGEDPKDPEFYRVHGAYLRSADVRGGGVTRPQYKAIALTYPGVIDCNLLGQAETYPADKAYMNVVTAVILANPLFTSSQFQDFVTFMKTKTIDNLEFLQLNPTAVNRTINVVLYCTSKADPNSVKLAVQTALQSLQTLRLGSLGFSIYRSDIEKRIRDAVGDPTLLDYFALSSPNDTIVQKNEYVNFTSITVESYYSTRDIVA